MAVRSRSSFAVRLGRGQIHGIVVDLREVEAEDASKGALELVAHGFEKARRAGAAAVEHDDAMSKRGVGVHVVDPDQRAIESPVAGRASSHAFKVVDHRAVGVEDNGDRSSRGVGGG